MSPGLEYCFGPYTIDLLRHQLLRDGRPVPLRPKTWAVLVHLVEAHGRLVTTTELLDQVWGRTAVTPEVVGVSIRELRRIFGDDRRQPRFIETVTRRGYRFIAEVRGRDDALPAEGRTVTRDAAGLPSGFVGREAELACLWEHFRASAGGARQVVFVTGEAGIGKTALVEVFLAQVSSADPKVLIGLGQCIEKHSEAYLPVLDALVSLCLADRGGAAVRQLRRYAPRWLAELPEVLAPGERTGLRGQAASSTPERMMRSLAQALESLSWQHPVLLVLEDLHWSDRATVDFLRYLAERTSQARLLLLATDRPVEVISRKHPIRGVKQSLLAHRRCSEVTLDFLKAEAVREYVNQRWPALPEAAGLANWLVERTSGSPLFMQTLTRQLVVEDFLRRDGEGWRLRGEFVRVGVPDSLRGLLLEQMERLPPEDRALIEAAAVAGSHFAAAAVAAALECDVVEADERLHRLAEDKVFVHAAGSRRWPDGTVSGTYAFVHSLYAEMLYARMAPARLQRLHRRIGHRLEQAFAGCTDPIAIDLAEHFGRAGDPERGCRYHRRAAALALERHAYHEAAVHLESARRLIEELPHTPATAEAALEVGTSLGSVRMATNGYAAAASLDAFRWALRHAGCDRHSSRRLFALIGFCTCLITRAELQRAGETAAELVALGAELGLPPAFAGLTHNPLGQVYFYRGEIEAALRELTWVRDQLRSAAPLRWLDEHRGLLWIDPYTACLNVLCLTLAVSDLAEEAEESSLDALDRARSLAHPFTLISALTHAALLAFVLERWGRAKRFASEAVDLAADCGFPFWVASASNVLGHAMAMDGETERGLGMLRLSMARWEETGTRLGRSLYRLMLAQAHLRAGDAAAAEALLHGALEDATVSSERVVEAELHRMLGRIRLARGDRAGASAAFTLAADVARRQGARRWQRRAAEDLASDSFSSPAA